MFVNARFAGALPVFCLVCCLLAVVPGCGGCGRSANQPRKPVFPVAGEVFFEGNPAKHVMVVLHPVDEAARAEIWPQGYPQGTVNADGSFQISTYEQEDGAPEGEYLILVVPTDAALNEPQRVTGDAPSAEVASGRGPGERFSTPDNPAGRCVVEAKDNKLPRLSLTGGA